MTQAPSFFVRSALSGPPLLLVSLALAALLTGAAAPAAHAQYEGDASDQSRDGPVPERDPRSEVDGRALASAIARHDRREPPVDRVVRAALAAGAPSLIDIRDLTTRARLAGLLPSLRVGAQRGTGWDLSERLDDNGRVQIGTDDELSLRAEAVFSLDRLLFAREEVPLSREVRAVHLVRRDLVEAVVRLYYERRRLMLERDLLGSRGVAAAMRIDEVTALLDAFTGGRFRRMLGGP